MWSLNKSTIVHYKNYITKKKHNSELFYLFTKPQDAKCELVFNAYKNKCLRMCHLRLQYIHIYIFTLGFMNENIFIWRQNCICSMHYMKPQREEEKEILFTEKKRVKEKWERLYYVDVGSWYILSVIIVVNTRRYVWLYESFMSRRHSLTIASTWHIIMYIHIHINIIINKEESVCVVSMLKSSIYFHKYTWHDISVCWDTSEYIN